MAVPTSARPIPSVFTTRDAKSDPTRDPTIEVQFPQQVDRIEHAVERAEDMRGHRPGGQREDDRVTPHDAQAFDDLVHDSRRRFARGSRWLRGADQHEGNRRYDERHGVDEDRERRAHDLYERAREAGASDLRDRRAHREPAVAFDQTIAANERWYVRGVRSVEERTEARFEEHDDVELLDPQPAKRVCDRDRQKKPSADEVVPDE